MVALPRRVMQPEATNRLKQGTSRQMSGRLSFEEKNGPFHWTGRADCWGRLFRAVLFCWSRFSIGRSGSYADTVDPRGDPW